jgi:TatD DNase family protein
MDSITYRYDHNLYINLTNRCTMACTFCIKNKWKGKFRGHDLRLEHEPSAQEVIAAIGDVTQYGEIVFCGYGEPLLRLDVLKEIAAWVKQHKGKVRINTAGHANLVYKRDITPELKGLVDAISISLNAPDADLYVQLTHPRYGAAAFDAVIAFARACAAVIPDVTLTAVELPGVDLEQCAAIARAAGVKFRARPYLDEYENA